MKKISFNPDNNKCFLKQLIWMISEGSCDTEDCSIDGWKYILASNMVWIVLCWELICEIMVLRFTVLLNCNIISQYYCIFDQIHAVLSFININKIVQTLNLSTVLYFREFDVLQCNMVLKTWFN